MTYREKETMRDGKTEFNMERQRGRDNRVEDNLTKT